MRLYQSPSRSSLSFHHHNIKNKLLPSKMPNISQRSHSYPGSKISTHLGSASLFTQDKETQDHGFIGTFGCPCIKDMNKPYVCIGFQERCHQSLETSGPEPDTAVWFMVPCTIIESRLYLLSRVHSTTHNPEADINILLVTTIWVRFTFGAEVRIKSLQRANSLKINAKRLFIPEYSIPRLFLLSRPRLVNTETSIFENFQWL